MLQCCLTLSPHTTWTGDFRMIVGEDRGKVRNIVHPHISEFCELYASALREVEDCVSQTGDCFHQVSPGVRAVLCVHSSA